MSKTAPHSYIQNDIWTKTAHKWSQNWNKGTNYVVGCFWCSCGSFWTSTWSYLYQWINQSNEICI